MNLMNISIILGALAAGAGIVEFLHRVTIRATSSDITVEHQPLRVQEETHTVTVAHLDMKLETYASKEDLTETERRLSKEMSDSFSALESKRRADIAGLHEKANATREEVAKLKERTEGQTALLVNMDAKLTNLMGRRER